MYVDGDAFAEIFASFEFWVQAHVICGISWYLPLFYENFSKKVHLVW